ncbi:MAG: hypothetical protein AB9919_13140 [Geobacteraceae bacterium]
MTTLNHNRPNLKDADNIRKAIAEIESWYTPEKNLTKQKKDRGLKTEIIARPPTLMAKKMISQKGLDERIHAIACSTVAHVQMHREVSLCNSLCLSLRGFRQEAMIQWFVTYAACSYDPQKKQLIFNKAGNNQVEACKKKTFLEFKRQTEEKSFHLRESVVKLVAKAENRLKEKTLHEIDEIEPAMLSALKKLISQ